MTHTHPKTTATRVMTGAAQLRLYETIGTVAEALPVDMRVNFVRVMRGPAMRIPDTIERARLRGRVYRALPAMYRDQWHWIIATLRDDGAATVWDAWVCDAGHARRTST